MQSIRFPAQLSVLALVFLWMADASAVPSFARQTGWDCTQCHMSWLELTNIGRRFKMGGYQVMRSYPDDQKRPLMTFDFTDPPPLIPLAFALQVSDTRTAKPNTTGIVKSSDLPLNNEGIIQQASVFLNGKLAEHVGCFCQATYDGAAGTTTIDNFEIRAADDYTNGKFEILYGLSLNNNPTMSDVWNTTPVWSWPYVGSSVAPAPITTPIINASLAQSAGGLTAYTLIARTLYLEAGVYRSTTGALAFMHANVPGSGLYYIDGVAPYYRVALQHDWNKGHQSIEAGSFGLNPKVYQPGAPQFGPTDHYRDTGFDAQYQYITDRHRFSTMLTYIKEKQQLDGTYANGGAAFVDHDVSFTNLKATYYFEKWYGASLGYQRTTGTSDSTLYGSYNPLNPSLGTSALTGSLTGSPNTTAWIGELDYLFSISDAQKWRKQRLVVQYTAYTKFNGASSNYNGVGRNASDNNTLYLLAWFMY